MDTEQTHDSLPGSSQPAKALPVPRPPLSAQPVDVRLLDYVDGFDKNLMCPICHCPFVGGTKLPCDHTFCRQCVTRAFSSQQHQGKTCPSCRAAATLNDLVPVPRFIVHMIDDLMVKCPEHLKGCQRVMRRGDVFIHIDAECEFCDVECVAPECRLRIPRNRYYEGCLHDMVRCDDCRVSMMKRDKEIHEERECSVKQWPCPYCQEEVIAKERERHSGQCQDAMVNCTARDVGCSFAAKRGEIKAHEKSCSIAQMRPTLLAFSSRLDRQEAEMSGIRYRNIILEKGLDSLKKTLDTAKPPPPRPSQAPPEGAAPLQNISTADVADVDAPFDSPTHHLLSLHETLREEIERVSGSVNELDARTSLMVMNENLRLKDEMTHLTAVVNSMRMQLQWLMSARLQAQQRLPPEPAGAPQVAGASPEVDKPAGTSGPVRRTSDSTKL